MPTFRSDVPASLNFPPVPAGAVIAGAAARYGDRVAFDDGDRQLSHAGLYEAACRFANALGGQGVGRGDVVVIHLPNCLEYAVAYYGVLLSGAAFSPANPLLPDDVLAAQLADCAAVAVLTGTTVPDVAGVRLVLSTAPEPAAGQVSFTGFVAEQPATPPEVPIVPDDLAHLAYTGGTTGRSKGVRLPHRNVVVNSLQSACWISGSVPVIDGAGLLRIEQSADIAEWPERLGEGSTIGLTPWFHAMGTIGGLHVPVLTGLRVRLHARFDPSAYLADAERLRVTQLGGAPALFAALMASPDFTTRDLAAVRLVQSGAAPMSETMILALRQRFPDAVVVEGYGLTEVTMGATANPRWTSGTRKVGSVGVAPYDTELKIVPVEGGQPLPAGVDGEVCIRGPQVMTGYHNRPEETAEVLVDGWLHTGDIGHLDEDGYLFVVDRKKDLLLYKGYNVYPRELEELLLAHPAVRGAAVVGRRDPEVGELAVAFVVRAPGHDGLAEEELRTAINEQVVPYKRLREVRFVDAIPVSAAGKVLKRELRDALN